MQNEATVFGGAQLPFEKEEDDDDVVRRLALFFPSLCCLLSDGRCVRNRFSSVVLFLCSSFPLLLARERKRERERDAHKSMHVNLEQKRRDVSNVCFWSSVDDVFLLRFVLWCFF